MKNRHERTGCVCVFVCMRACVWVSVWVCVCERDSGGDENDISENFKKISAKTK